MVYLTNGFPGCVDLQLRHSSVSKSAGTGWAASFILVLMVLLTSMISRLATAPEFINLGTTCFSLFLLKIVWDTEICDIYSSVLRDRN